MTLDIEGRLLVCEQGTLSTPARIGKLDRHTEAVAVDGIKVDLAGNLYVCGPGGIWVLSADGRHLGTIKLPEGPHNLHGETPTEEPCTSLG